ncbi:hypothetical protein A2886_03185 [candidate division WWE3 bacterium RIFCSPHIGHO2_01_FULL_42_13]|uniref:Uncharacterized protein n=1 Tax=candidate division WWE3 bacterium RIFCSPHIGHO2_01_FULL_42_13 TaxID=1802617 RepID=A0A1F4UR70_UNCKA|nr:MAG: hypothetical protein A2886_03185 [candidate division WWE3 bacterium RIFCSPHIGHO2_01_FULL_42_13]
MRHIRLERPPSPADIPLKDLPLTGQMRSKIRLAVASYSTAGGKPPLVIDNLRQLADWELAEGGDVSDVKDTAGKFIFSEEQSEDLLAVVLYHPLMQDHELRQQIQPQGPNPYEVHNVPALPATPPVPLVPADIQELMDRAPIDPATGKRDMSTLSGFLKKKLKEWEAANPTPLATPPAPTTP